MEQRIKSPRTAAWIGGLALSASLLGACSLSLDTDQNQCSKASDCDSKIGGTSTQLCVKGLCQAVACETDMDCRGETGREELKTSHCSSGVCLPSECTKGGGECGDTEVCDIARGLCLNKDNAACGAAGSVNVLDPDKDCDNYEGLETYICEDSQCEAPQCKSDGDCTEVSSTAVCDSGRCSDKTWECIGQEDPREPQMSGTATFKIKVVNVLGEAPIKKNSEGIGVTVKVCGSVQLDPECAMPLPGAATVYDENTGDLTVTGLMAGGAFRLTVEAPGFLPVDFYTQRPPINETVESQPILLVPPAIVGSLEEAFADKQIKVDLEMYGTLIARIFDCQEKPAAGASIQISEVVTGTEVFYLEGITVLPDETATTNSGSGGIANVKSNGTVDISIVRGTQLVTTFKDLRARTQRLTYINFYPRDYVK